MPATQMQKTLARRLHELGYLWDIKPDQLDKLGSSKRLKDAVQGYQDFMSIDLQVSVARHHDGRAAVADGDAGPATEQILLDAKEFPRCPLPDSPPPPNASFFYENKMLHIAVERMQHSAAMEVAEGTGSLPAGCHADKLDGYPGHAMSIHFDRRRLPSRLASREAELNRMVFEAYRTMGGQKDTGIYLFEVDDPDYADVHSSWRNGRGWIGLAQFNNATCRDVMFNYRDPGWVPRGGSIDGDAQLHAHELGHNNNGQHSPQRSGNIMSPSIVWPSSGFRGWHADDHRTPTFLRFYKGDFGPMPGSPPGPGPGPQPPPTHSDGTLVLKGVEYDVVRRKSTITPIRF